jgi:hypothetical protein
VPLEATKQLRELVSWALNNRAEDPLGYVEEQIQEIMLGIPPPLEDPG